MKRDSDSREQHSKIAPTISQVAKISGVSRATVSRAFTRPEMLSEETVRRVKAVGKRSKDQALGQPTTISSWPRTVRLSPIRPM